MKRSVHRKDMKMTLKDFLKVFDFNGNKIRIYSFIFNAESLMHEPHMFGEYYTAEGIENDFCVALNNVIKVLPLDESTIEILVD